MAADLKLDNDESISPLPPPRPSPLPAASPLPPSCPSPQSLSAVPSSPFLLAQGPKGKIVINIYLQNFGEAEVA